MLPVVQTYPSTLQFSFCETLVLFSGWGMESQVWETILPSLIEKYNIVIVDLPGYGSNIELAVEPALMISENIPKNNTNSIEDIAKQLIDVIPEQSILVGWSMGGMVATYLSHAYPKRYRGLICIASNPCFVQKPHWPHAVSIEVFDQFQQGVELNSRKTLKRFIGLQCLNAVGEKKLVKQLRSIPIQVSDSTLAGGLSMMKTLDLTSSLKKMNIPVLHILGELDQLMPSVIAKDLQLLNAQHKTHVVVGAGHLPFLSHPEEVLSTIDDFINTAISSSVAGYVDKRAIAASFSRSAPSYDSVANFQRSTAQRLIKSLKAEPSTTVVDVAGNAGVKTIISVKTIVDIGCGTGAATEQLALLYPAAVTIGLDIADGMLRYGEAHHPTVDGWIGGDAESLPLKTSSIDKLFSNLAVQWCSDVNAFLKEAARVLVGGGQFYFTTLGPKTFCELRSSWGQVDGFTHVNNFIDRSEIEEAAIAAGFEIASSEAWLHVDEYDHVKDFTRELKALGAHNMNQGRAKGLTGKAHYHDFMNAYEQYRLSNGKIPATYEVYLFELRLKESREANA